MKYKGILIASDYDGTIAIGANISKENIEAVKHFQIEGGLFTLASGRQTAFFNEIKNELPMNAPYVGLNGTKVTDPVSGEIIIEKTMTSESVIAALEYYKRTPSVINLSFFGRRTALRMEKEGEALTVRLHDDTDPSFLCIGELRMESLSDIRSAVTEEGNVRTGCKMIDGFLSEGVYKAVLYSSSARVHVSEMLAVRDELAELYGSTVTVSRSWPHGVELQHKDTSKGIALEHIKKYTSSRLLIAMGNYENDISMLESADIGVAVADSSPDCLEAADIVVSKCKDNAVSDFIYNYLPKIAQEYLSENKQKQEH